MTLTVKSTSGRRIKRVIPELSSRHGDCLVRDRTARASLFNPTFDNSTFPLDRATRSMSSTATRSSGLSTSSARMFICRLRERPLARVGRVGEGANSDTSRVLVRSSLLYSLCLG